MRCRITDTSLSGEVRLEGFREGNEGRRAVTRADLYHAVDQRPGPIAATGRDTDVAIMGRGFFELTTPDGPVYTRDGSFNLNAQRQLVNASGLVLQGLRRPSECPAFGSTCTPEHPLGAPMVSAEGACAAYHRYRPVAVPEGAEG